MLLVCLLASVIPATATPARRAVWVPLALARTEAALRTVFARAVRVVWDSTSGAWTLVTRAEPRRTWTVRELPAAGAWAEVPAPPAAVAALTLSLARLVTPVPPLPGVASDPQARAALRRPTGRVPIRPAVPSLPALARRGLHRRGGVLAGLLCLPLLLRPREREDPPPAAPARPRAGAAPFA